MTPSLLLSVLQTPNLIVNFNPKQWNLLLRQARTSGMLARLYQKIAQQELLSSIPEKCLNHFTSSATLIEFQKVQTMKEVAAISLILKNNNIRAIYLKGAAYVLADLPLARSRIFSDIDLLVAKEDIVRVERILKCYGWVSQKTDDYDQAYYRQYMHEIPPMQQLHSGTILDIHHNILPICTANSIDIEKLTQNPQQWGDDKQYNVLRPCAMFLHSAIHLFHEGEFEHGLRGISDLSLLYQTFTEQDEHFTSNTIKLAQTINQQYVLCLSFYYMQKHLSIVLNKSAQHYIDNYQAQHSLSQTSKFIFEHALDCIHTSTMTWPKRAALKIGYLRGHLLRMPLKLLLPHLIKKSVMRLNSKD